MSLSNCFPLSKTKTLNAEAANNVLLDEASDILLSDSGQRFCLDPFNEIVDPEEEEFELPYCMGKGPIMSSPYCANGQEAFIGVSYSDGCHMM